ncbi:MAG: DUF354 domain-containing protein [Bacteroidales bacterium]|nr:DUF354 domain-containing protein [Bacteroidales bacterium]
MRILIDIGHPAHIHLLRYTSEELKKRGHNVFFSVRDIPVAKRLMDYYEMKYFDLGKKRNSIIGKLWTIISQDIKLLFFVWKNKIDIGLSSGIVLPHVSKLSKMKSFVFDDDDDAVEPLVVKYAHPFSDIVFTPSAIKRKTPHALYYNGCHELAYLHPNYFTPDVMVLKKAGLTENEIFFILRFVAFNGHHDVGQSGISLEQKKNLISLLSQYGRVIITSEKPIESDFEQYRLPVPPEEIHSLMYYATMFIGDSQTMTSEAAIMGVPALKCNTFAGKLSVPNELEYKYGLCYAYHPNEFEKFYKHIEMLLKQPNIKKEWCDKKEKFLQDNIDVTAFFTDYINNYSNTNKKIN